MSKEAKLFIVSSTLTKLREAIAIFSHLPPMTEEEKELFDSLQKSRDKATVVLNTILKEEK
jgi:CHAD domain-containing protein